jgi:hypothetical protein
MEGMRQLFTAREVAERAQRSKSQVNRDASNGLIAVAQQTPGRQGVRLFDAEEVERYVERYAPEKVS